jgi:hypothetical protein
MPFGLINVGATFQRAMQISFDDLIGIIIQIYLDDLMVYSKIKKIILIISRQVFLCCRKYGMSLNPSKSIFGVLSGKLLGHVVFDSGINIDPERVRVIQNLPIPSSKKGI